MMQLTIFRKSKSVWSGNKDVFLYWLKQLIKNPFICSFAGIWTVNWCLRKSRLLSTMSGSLQWRRSSRRWASFKSILLLLFYVHMTCPTSTFECVCVMSQQCEWLIWWILCLCCQIVDLFTDSKQKLDQCTEDLQEKNQRLEEAHKDLTETRHRLTQEEFIASQLQSNEVQLYSTADQVRDGRSILCVCVFWWCIDNVCIHEHYPNSVSLIQLLNTAEVSTQDVSGLHAKLQRKKEVELHNGEVQQSFAQRMENCYNSMQTSLHEQSHKHAAMIDYYRSSVGKICHTDSLSVSIPVLGHLKSLPARVLPGNLTSVQMCLCRWADDDKRHCV